ncbi:KAP P-loop domain protein [Pseudoxanthomonas suwonensis 11-1]|uniref:KAP P-loop domain protein n=1 Tax=Pseudoxanthomonas suwonensis (strain 11-1) TaxID=743721 RepID=E6WWG5_PSEUU|nr:P-loop NTPase fold protein [Pseudoxanthomonas suwonensis]ADV28442.1 KAP P-loop domain protein [Pseudoxanthomonas suwonensis 11-1]
MSANRKLPVDNPITSARADALGRASQAQLFAENILGLDSDNGVVAAVLGPWGSGKTSFINLAKECIRERGVPVLEFNPWMFSGADQLVQAFFSELSAQLKQKDFGEISELIDDYGELISGLAWVPLVGPWLARLKAAFEIISRILRGRAGSADERRRRIQEALKGLDEPIVVILDDIDRLTHTEVRDIFKLVRLTARFPRIIYLLAFDRLMVECALGEGGLPGREYLEKIVNLGFDLPRIPEQVMDTQIIGVLGDSLGDAPGVESIDRDAWLDIYAEIVRPLIKNMRDVRRYSLAAYSSAHGLEGRVAIADVLGLEAVRIFIPDVFDRLHAYAPVLTGADLPSSDSQYAADQIRELLDSSGNNRDVVLSMIKRLFPAAQKYVGGSAYGVDFKNGWLARRRVAHEDVLRFYLERLASEGLKSFTDADSAWRKIGDESEFDEFLRSIPNERLLGVVSSLEAFEDQFESQHMVPASVVLLNLIPKVHGLERSPLGRDASLVVGRVVYRLIRRLESHAAVEKVVRDILPRVETLSSKLRLISMVGYRDGVGHRLVSEDAARQLELEWRAAVHANAPDLLAEEWDVLRVLLMERDLAGPHDPVLGLPDSIEMTEALLRSAMSEAVSMTAGNRAVRRSTRLAWETLVKILGGEDELRRRIDALKDSGKEQVDESLELACKYLSGWRPQER